MLESTSNEVEDIDFVIRDLQYSSIIDVPFYTRLLHHFFLYFGKINSLVSSPTYLGYIYYIIIMIQSFLPAFLIDCKDLWPRNSLMTTIISVVGYFFQGPHGAIKSARVIMSIIISIIFIILIALLIVRTLNFHKTGRVQNGEIKFFYFMFKYIMPLFCPHLMSGLAISFDQIINQNRIDYNILQIILSILSFAFYFYLLFAVVTPRVLLEDTPTHDWFPFLTVASVANTTLLSVVSGIAGCVDGKNRAGCSLWMMVQSLSLGFLFFMTNGVIKPIINVVSSSFFFAASFTSLLLTVNIFISKHLSPEVVVIVAFIVLILLIIIFKIVKQMKVTKILTFIDNFVNSGDSLENVFENNYKNPFCFLFDIQAVIDIWIEFAGDFELFEIAVSKWPDNFNLLLLYSRLLAIFPNKNEQLISIVSKISKMDGSSFQTAYMYQCRNLLRRRQTSMTPLFKERLEQINSKTEIIMETLKRFWENILQKNCVNFWSNSEQVIHRIEDLDSLYAQILDDYPNNYQLLNSYQNYVSNIKKDFRESHKTMKKMEILEKNGFIKSNLALEIASQVFPQLNNCIQISQSNQIEQSLRTSTKSNNNENETNNEVSNDDGLRQSNQNANNQLEFAFDELIHKSKLGTIWITCVILVVITIVVIVIFYLYVNRFHTQFVDKQRNAIDFMLDVQMFCHELNFFCVNLNLLPLVLENDVKTPISINNRTEFTEYIAPELFAQGKIPEFSLTPESLVDLLSDIVQRYASMTESLSSLNKNDEYIQQINYNLYEDKKYKSTLNELTINIINIALEILKITKIKEFYEENGLYYDIKNNFLIINQMYSNISSLAYNYATLTYDSNYDGLNELMILVNLINLILLVVPYLIQLFLLSIQSDSIAESFTLFPNTEIRSIINEFGKESSKIEKDTSQISSLNNIIGKTKSNITTIVLTFLSSFIVVLICSLIIYLDAKGFITSAELISHEIYTLTPSFSSLSLAFTQALRFYMLAHDGDFEHMVDLESNLYGSPSDNLYELVNSTYAMLNLSYIQYSTGMMSGNGGINFLINKNLNYFDYFNDSFDNEYRQIFPQKAFFEELATDNLFESISHIQDFLWFYINDMKSGLDMYEESGLVYSLIPCTNEILKFSDIIYWFSNFSEVNRTQIYFSLIIADVYNKISSNKVISNTCFYIVIVWQIFACIYMILYLINRHTKIKKSLLFYQYIKPEIVLQNQNIMKLIESGHQISNDNDTTFSNADYIISKISQGIVVTEKDFTITNFNDAFIKMCQLNGENINGEILTDLITNDEQEKSWQNLIQHVEDSISGKNKTKFKEDITVKLRNEKICHLNCTVICLTKDGVSNYDGVIEKVVFIFDDNTEMFIKSQLISQERSHLNKMLLNAMPSRIIQNFLNSSDLISFTVQSVTIGIISIKAEKNFNKEIYEEFTFYNEIFERFDNEIKQFDLLTKLSNFSQTYSFVGGLFSEVNKPERHSEESIKFALKLLSIIPELSEKYDAEIHFTIGVHTGGPIVAGVLDFENPTFQLIGTVSEIADQVKSKGVQDQICVTRAVYELIFSASFNVQEQGDTAIRGGKIIPTYLVKL